MLSNLLTVDGALRTFFYQLTDAIGFGGYLGIIIAVEVLFILLFAIKSIFSYEHRLKRSLDKANAWLFKNLIPQILNNLMISSKKDQSVLLIIGNNLC